MENRECFPAPAGSLTLRFLAVTERASEVRQLHCRTSLYARSLTKDNLPRLAQSSLPPDTQPVPGRPGHSQAPRAEAATNA